MRQVTQDAKLRRGARARVRLIPDKALFMVEIRFRSLNCRTIKISRILKTDQHSYGEDAVYFNENTVFS